MGYRTSDPELIFFRCVSVIYIYIYIYIISKLILGTQVRGLGARCKRHMEVHYEHYTNTRAPWSNMHVPSVPHEYFIMSASKYQQKPCQKDAIEHCSRCPWSHCRDSPTEQRLRNSPAEYSYPDIISTSATTLAKPSKDLQPRSKYINPTAALLAHFEDMAESH